MKLIDTADAAGQVLCHDITQIIRGKAAASLRKNLTKNNKQVNRC